MLLREPAVVVRLNEFVPWVQSRFRIERETVGRTDTIGGLCATHLAHSGAIIDCRTCFMRKGQHRAPHLLHADRAALTSEAGPLAGRFAVWTARAT